MIGFLLGHIFIVIFHISGETLLTSSKWFVSIEGRVTHSIDDQLDFAAALSVFFGCFYVFNIEYEESASATLELIQR